MARLTRTLMLAFLLCVATAGTAAAQDYPPSPSVAGIQGSQGQGQGGTEAGTEGTAFTGGPDIEVGTIFGASFLVLGLAALLVGWRRAGRLAADR